MTGRNHAEMIVGSSQLLPCGLTYLNLKEWFEDSCAVRVNIAGPSFKSDIAKPDHDVFDPASLEALLYAPQRTRLLAGPLSQQMPLQ